MSDVRGRSCSSKEFFSCWGASKGGLWGPSVWTWGGALYSSKLLSFPGNSFGSFGTSCTMAEIFFFFWLPFCRQSVLWWPSWSHPKHRFLSWYFFRSWEVSFFCCDCLAVTVLISIASESFDVCPCKVWAPRGCWELHFSCYLYCQSSICRAMLINLLRDSGWSWSDRQFFTLSLSPL